MPQGCCQTAKHVAAMLGRLEERHLGSLQAESSGRAEYLQELEAIPGKDPSLMDTFAQGVAFHNTGAHRHMLAVSQEGRSCAYHGISLSQPSSTPSTLHAL